jgi:flotillin
MARMGLEVVNLTIQNFIDDNNVITDLGIENISQIRKDAAISKANAERDVAIAQAQASDQSNKAKVAAEVSIAEQNKDLSIRRAQFKIEEDQKRAAADAAYKIQEEAERRSIEIASAEADIARREKEIELREREVQLKEKELEANVKKKAEAERYAAEQAAEAKKYQEAQAAEAKRIAMEEEAKGIEAIGIAEARALELKAEAMAKLNEAGKLEMLLSAMPEIVKAASDPLNKVSSITMYGDGNSTKLVRDVMTTVNQVSEGVGLDIPGLISQVLPKNDKEK